MKLHHTKSSFRKQCMSDKVFDVVNVTLMVVLAAIFLWPLIFVLSASFSDPAAVTLGKVWLFPKGFTLEGYKAIFEYKNIWIGYNEYTDLYGAWDVHQSGHDDLRGRIRFRARTFVPESFCRGCSCLPFFSRTDPSYMVVVNLGIYDTIWAMVLPSAVHFLYIIIMRTYFQTNIPQALFEAAELDGANTAQVLFRIVLPLSGPILAVMALYYGVGKWNSYFDALVYMGTQTKYPLQLFLREILINNQIDLNMAGLDIAAAEAKLQLALIHQVRRYRCCVAACFVRISICAEVFCKRNYDRGGEGMSIANKTSDTSTLRVEKITADREQVCIDILGTAMSEDTQFEVEFRAPYEIPERPNLEEYATVSVQKNLTQGCVRISFSRMLGERDLLYCKLFVYEIGNGEVLRIPGPCYAELREAGTEWDYPYPTASTIKWATGQDIRKCAGAWTWTCRTQRQFAMHCAIIR